MAGSGGSVRQRPNARWEGRYRADGRQRSVYGATKAEAQAKLRKALAELDNGIRQPTGRMTVSQWLTEWLDTGVRRSCRERTVVSYEATARLHIKPYIGSVPLARLEPEHVTRMLATLEAKGTLSPTSVAYVRTVLRIALARAVKSGKVTRNAAALTDAPAKVRPSLTPLTADQARSLLASVADDRLGPLFTLAVATGLRQGEVLALRWQDIDIDGGSLSVRHTMSRRGHTLAEPKTPQSRRTLALSGTTASALREQRRRQAADRLASGRRWANLDLVFTTANGTPLDGGNVNRSLRAALTRAGLPHQRFHDLRHLHVALMLEAGDDIAAISKSLGHSTIATTVDVYSHLSRKMSEKSAERLDKILAR